MSLKLTWLATPLLLVCVHLAEAQQAKKAWRIGVLSGGYRTQSVQLEPFRQGLRELSYVEGQNIVIEYRYSEGKHEAARAIWILGGQG